MHSSGEYRNSNSKPGYIFDLHASGELLRDTFITHSITPLAMQLASDSMLSYFKIRFLMSSHFHGYHIMTKYDLKNMI